MTSEERAKIFSTALSADCCLRCALRFAGAGDYSSNFHNLEENVNKPWFPRSSLSNDQQGAKKNRLNPCVVCLNALNDLILDEMATHKGVNQMTEYDCDSFVNYVSFPTAILIREHSMGVYMKEKYADFFNDHAVIPINKAWSFAIQNRIARVVKKEFDRDSNLMVKFTVSYPLEREESSVMYQFEKKFEKYSRDENLSRNIVVESLKNIVNDIFKQNVPVPPLVSTQSIVLDQVTCSHEPIFVVGRYCKYLRNLGQTPWVVDKVKIFETSVQDIIFEPLERLFSCTSLVFSASGREDFDVRTLGRGRPFFIRICDPKVTKLSGGDFRQMEDEIRDTKIISVRDLQFMDKKSLIRIKEGEETKRKTYRALCVIDKPEKLDEYLEKINKLTNIVLQQKTPLRVYHRRSYGVRQKEIFDIKARSIAGRENLFELDVVTQAGTYVKEFVHGDLGRTQPSLGSLIGGFVDILALDVLDIHLDFPPIIL